MKKILLIFSLCGILPTTFMYAEDEEPPTLPIDLGKGKPERPKAPSRNHVYCYLDGSQLVIENSCEAYGFITLTETITDNTVFQTTAMLYPEYRINIVGLSGSYTLSVNIDGHDYQTLIIL